MPTTIVETNEARVPLEKIRADLAVQEGVTAKNGFAIGRRDVVGIIDADGLARRRTKTLADGAGFSTGSAQGVVEDASLFTDGDVLKDSGGTTIGTIAADGVNTTTNTITLTGNAAVAVADGAAVLGSDGSEVAKCIADEGSDGSGDTQIRTFIGGYLDESLINGLDSTAKTELGGISTVGGIFKF